MHNSSFQHMKDAVNKHLKDMQGEVLDIGSYDVNGSYKIIFTENGFTYTGADLEDGPNVDVVLSNPYKYPFKSNKFDVVVSGQAFEHIEFFWISMLEMVRVTKVGGIIILIAPSRGPEHKFPNDCWRFYPDGFKALSKFAGLDLIDQKIDWDGDQKVEANEWGDCVGVFIKKKPTFKRYLLTKVSSWLAMQD